MVGILLLFLYYSNIVSFFVFFVAYKVIFNLSTNSIKLVYQIFVVKYGQRVTLLILVLLSIGLIPSTFFFGKYVLVTETCKTQPSFIGFLFFFNLLSSTFFYTQFLAKWHPVTPEEFREIIMLEKKYTSDSDKDTDLYNKQQNIKKYYFLFFVHSYILFNFLSPFFFADFFMIFCNFFL